MAIEQQGVKFIAAWSVSGCDSVAKAVDGWGQNHPVWCSPNAAYLATPFFGNCRFVGCSILTGWA